MSNLIICVGMFYVLHLFLKMTFSLHKVPFVDFTYTEGNISNTTALSERMSLASDNLRQSLPCLIKIQVILVVFIEAKAESKDSFK